MTQYIHRKMVTRWYTCKIDDATEHIPEIFCLNESQLTCNLQWMQLHWVTQMVHNVHVSSAKTLQVAHRNKVKVIWVPWQVPFHGRSTAIEPHIHLYWHIRSITLRQEYSQKSHNHTRQGHYSFTTKNPITRTCLCRVLWMDSIHFFKLFPLMVTRNAIRSSRRLASSWKS